MSGSDGELEVAEILGERKSRKGIEYLVKWKDFGSSNNSWEPLKNLVHAVKAIAVFHTQSVTSQKKRSRTKSPARSRSRSRSRRRSSSKSSLKGKKTASPIRKTSSSRKSLTTKTTTSSSPTKEEVKTETVTKSPGRLEKTSETLTRSVLTPGATQRSTHITLTSEVLTTTKSNEPARPVQSVRERFLQQCRDSMENVRGCCAGVYKSDYPAIVVFSTIAIIMISFLLEKQVDFEKLWETIVAFCASIWMWLTGLVSKKD